MKNYSEEFISSKDKNKYRFQIGRHTASSLSGFIAGVVFASIVWVLLLIYYKDYILATQ